MKTTGKVCASVIAIVVLCTLCSAYFVYNGSKGLLESDYENELRIESGAISGAIENSFLRPIAVSETMSKDLMMKTILDIRTKDEVHAMEDNAREYLSSIRDGFGYSMVFAVSDATMAYFTYDGLSRYADPYSTSSTDDLWYKTFLEKETDKPYCLDVDTDKVNNWTLSVFVNTGVYGKKGELLGVCGVGVDTTELQKVIEYYERIYDVKIDLVNGDGLIQIDTDTERIEKDYIEIEDLELYSDEQCYYEISSGGCRTITYIDDLDWYLIVQNESTLNSNVLQLILPSLICMLIGIILIGVVMYFGLRNQQE